MRQPTATEDHPVAREVEARGHPTQIRPLTVVVSANQDLLARKRLQSFLDIRLLTDSDVAEMDNQVFRLDSRLPVLDDPFREIRRPVTISCDLFVIQMR